MDRPHFFFSFELSYPARPLKRRLGGLPRLAVRLSKIPLAVPAFTVQNDRAWSCVAHRAATTDRAEIGRIRRRNAHVEGGSGPRVVRPPGAGSRRTAGFRSQSRAGALRRPTRFRKYYFHKRGGTPYVGPDQLGHLHSGSPLC